jgi:hypothetical protein
MAGSTTSFMRWCAPAGDGLIADVGLSNVSLRQLRRALVYTPIV